MVVNKLDLDEILSPKNAAVLLVNSPLELQPICWKKFWKESHSRFAADGASNFLKRFCEDESLNLPDLITGDLDSIVDDSKKFFLDKDVEICETEDQNFTDMTKLLMEVDKRGYTSKVCF